ncbi:hypothetical protein Y032_0018g3679 [Ancylostoma ceylanicum]|uniref:Uncharacterized protein n=1 Tax=Ancylostoma ceylanicum TaxID=53326 RepID=A0A016V5S2_9BILA|nr:hypothetical protein Y032_0018g3679 [Ancylostoma ceylanicum]
MVKYIGYGSRFRRKHWMKASEVTDSRKSPAKPVSNSLCWLLFSDEVLALMKICKSDVKCAGRTAVTTWPPEATDAGARFSLTPLASNASDFALVFVALIMTPVPVMAPAAIAKKNRVETEEEM